MRLTAKRIPLKALDEGNYVVTEGKWESNYLEHPVYGKVSRVAIYGVVISKYENKAKEVCSITVDDFTGDVRVVGFRGMAKYLEKFDIGDIVLVVGKLKKGIRDELYISPEIVRRVSINHLFLNAIENFKVEGDIGEI
ncbi:OB-fold nucleic acid binding domain-containing protein [Methanotorris igneus]|uniref:Nucleic acid binding OB-fold tRNA/helicase-type n=1 Tax=Methanotorris igneus (strain DSM 5666 / JCM 11834 / Kol 5) TaxID=880724 RepID=F6BDN7_METIK|nr:OB-fold nucleic acid binding domain-containing protein [Methanotorris igneus]AEF96598.1 nucleic acid binding OB-fold tRNA/helicase-type [Methanotorris igneus Kol 5]